jgi:hypothetical protein
MKSLLALLALLAVASTVRAQNVDTQSDAYVCYHGRADDPRTNAACDRVQAQASQPVAQVAPPPVPKGDANAPQNAAALAVAPNPSSPKEAKATAPAAQAAPTDIGEAPLNAQANAEESNSDEGDNDVHIHGSWLAGLGALAIIAIAIGCFIALAIHFIPTVIAIARRKRNAVWIFLVNLFLGWTVVGWVWALVWSLMTEPV